jgi:hypothetical protein
VVDNHRYNRLAFHVLEDAPTQDHVLDFLTNLKGQLDRRGLFVYGLTTDGSVRLRREGQREGTAM